VIAEQRALVVEDEEDWQRELVRALKELFGDNIDVARDLDPAWLLLNSRHYELVTVDLSLVGGTPSNAFTPNKKGFELLKRLRQSHRDTPAPALVIVTAHPTSQVMIEAFTEHHVDDFMEKFPDGNSFDRDTFVERMRRVLLRARLRMARRRFEERDHVTIVASSDHLLSGIVSGSIVLMGPDAHLDAAAFGQRADRINDLIVKGGGEWRKATRKIGGKLYESLVVNDKMARILAGIRERNTPRDPAVVEFAGPSELLRVPFELITTGDEYLCFESIITRSLTVDSASRGKPRHFHDFIAHLIATDQPLNALVVGANIDGRLPAVDVEVERIAAQIHRILDTVGLPHSVETLSGATYEAIRDRLSTGTMHLFHYAGHGRFESKLPEASGMIVNGDNGTQILRAAELKQLLTGSGIQVVFLSCCVGARTASRLSSGDFHGTLEAVARAGIPTAIGYRWIVFDDAALAFATTFYEELMSTFSPELAMFRTRIVAAADAVSGRNNSMWASPILISQI
jgi:DNA-binding response OmpR family regulator